MTSILIPSYARDIHATAIAAALRQRGQSPIVWHGADFPTRQTSSMWISGTEARWEVRGTEIGVDSSQAFDVVWYRRPSSAVLPQNMHPGDREVAKRECREFNRGLWKFVSPSAFWVNPLGSRAQSQIKALQLTEAIALGFRVPPTLLSNDPEDIRAFLKMYPGETIYKPFLAALWTNEDAASYLFTNNVSLDDLPKDDILKLTPGIFQRRIPKAYELRITYMGALGFAAKLLSQNDEDSTLDWRASFTRLPVEPTSIPCELDRACRLLMERLGIVFGCFDLMVTPEGDYYFLEVNEMGQFLWLEEINPDILLLDPFCEFLIQGKMDFKWHRSPGSLRYEDFRSEAIRRQEEHECKVHVDERSFFAVEDRVEASPATSS